MGSQSGYSKMKFQLFTLAVFVLFSAVVAHEEINCMACGQQTEGSESPYTGICKNADDLGTTTECNEEEFKSCMTGVITITLKNGTSDAIYIKNCGKTLDYHATGCLQVDNSDDEISFAGSLCYCETDNCNNNFDNNSNNSATDNIVNVITVV